MPATEYHITELEQGSTFQLDVTVTDPDSGQPLNLTGYTARSQARKDYADTSPAFEFDVSVPTASGLIVMSLSDAVAATIPKGGYVYDLELVTPYGKVFKLIKGKIRVTPEVTK